MINNRRFRQLDIVVDDAYEIEMNKNTVTYALSVNVGFFILQYANMRMLQFYYDLINRYMERPLFQYFDMDTDSAVDDANEIEIVREPSRTPYPYTWDSSFYSTPGCACCSSITTSSTDTWSALCSSTAKRIQTLPIWPWPVSPSMTSCPRLSSECCDEHRNEYVRCRLADRLWTGDEACCKARRAFDKRTPGLFKVEWSGDGFVGLCSKTYYCFGATDMYSTEGFSKRHNAIDKDAFVEVRRSGIGTNRGFRVHHSTVLTYSNGRPSSTFSQTCGARGRVTTNPVDV